MSVLAGQAKPGAGEAKTIKRRTATLSIVSNTTLILLKLVAATVTGSVALLTEAVHSSVDLIASVVAYYSVRKAAEPADAGHRYGHDKVENLAAAIEAVLMLVGSVAIAIEAVRRLVHGGSTHTLGIGIAVITVSAFVNTVVSTVIGRGARSTNSPALEGDASHLRADALSSGVVMVALILVDITHTQWIDPVAALVVAAWILFAGIRVLTRAGQVLIDESLPSDENDRIGVVISGFGERGVIGFHELRTRRGGSQRYVDVHLQFVSGTSLEQAHWVAHDVKDAITDALGGADVLIHIEPEERVRAGQRLPTGG
jgi:cation diffusion facilitator family transporter